MTALLRTLIDALARWPVLLLYMALIIGISSIPIGVHQPPSFQWDKIAHVIEYAGLGFLVTWVSWRLSGRPLLTWPFVAGGIVFATAFGVVDELYQGLISGRDSSVEDVIADLVGAVIGSSAALAISRFLYPQDQLDA